jgi:hypothetical protein
VVDQKTKDRERVQPKLVAAIERHTSATVDEVVEWRSGSTWNDGGSWYRIVARVGCDFWIAAIHSDYQPDIAVTQAKRTETVIVTYE